MQVRGSFSGIKTALKKLERIPDKGNRIVIAAADRLHQEAVENLATQGRSSQPYLSYATRQIYKRRGAPTGRAIRQHIDVSHKVDGNVFAATCGVPSGKPTMIAKVQNFGAIIRVTPRMRGFLAVNGIYLKKSTQAIKIPARRFWTKALNKAKRQFKSDIGKLLP